MPKTRPTPAAEVKPKIVQNIDMWAGSEGHNTGITQTMDAAEQNPDDTADRGENDRLQSKLQKNIPFARADGFANADLARPLRNAHQHNIHHAHAANDQAPRSRSQTCPTNNMPVSWFHTSEIESEVKTAKLSGLSWRNFSPAPQQLPDFVNGLRHVIVRRGFGTDPVIFQFGMQAF